MDGYYSTDRLLNSTVGRTPWSAADAPVGLLAARRKPALGQFTELTKRTQFLVSPYSRIAYIGENLSSTGILDCVPGHSQECLCYGADTILHIRPLSQLTQKRGLGKNIAKRTQEVCENKEAAKKPNPNEARFSKKPGAT